MIVKRKWPQSARMTRCVASPNLDNRKFLTLTAGPGLAATAQFVRLVDKRINAIFFDD